MGRELCGIGAPVGLLPLSSATEAIAIGVAFNTFLAATVVPKPAVRDKNRGG